MIYIITKNLCTVLFIALAMLCMVYGSFVRAVGSGTLFFLVWIGLGVFFSALAAVIRMGIWRKIPGAFRKAFFFLLCGGLISFGVVELCILQDFDAQGPPDLDYIIVLGAQVYPEGPSSVLRSRLQEAEAYLKENPETLCIVSGGQGRNEHCPEAEVMAQYLEEKGISPERILLETTSKTTAENIRFSKVLMQPHASVGIVTNNFHVFRALQIARTQGLSDARGIAAYSVPFYLPNNMLREYFGEIKFLLKEVQGLFGAV